jgi:hypothetical protein
MLVGAAGIDDCAARCARLPWCAAVTFDPKTNRCYHATADTPIQSNQTALTARCALSPSRTGPNRRM